MAAVFLSDIVSWRIRNVVKPVVEILAAIPSVAYGFFAVLVLAPWLQRTFGFTTGTNALNASLILAIMALPTIISVAEDSISALGRELREASYSLGATRMETIVKVVIPAAHSGIIAAVVLGMMRAIGETMVVWMASGNATQIPQPWWDVTQSIRTMTATIAGEMGETPEGSLHRSGLFAIGVLLLLMTFGLNIVSEYFLSRAKKAAGKA
jgi:phosphate transport system permease protein